MKPARTGAGGKLTPINQGRRHALVVDLNNFSTFPTLAIGSLLAALRNEGFRASLLSPLANGVSAAAREHPERYIDHLARRVHLSTWGPFQSARDAARTARAWWADRADPRVVGIAAAAIAERPDIVLLSAYMQHYPTAVEIGKLAALRGIPMLVGGPMFNIREAVPAWLKIPGLVAIVGSEVDLILPRIVEAACSGEDLLQFDGVTLPDGRFSSPAPPLRKLDEVPVPDFTDFPWDRYRARVVPMMTGRGCQWNQCNFCSDVISVSGRTYRTRSIDNVLNEMKEQSRRHNAANFLFLDLKLNSNPAMFRGIIENAQSSVPGSQWIGTVHVDQRKDNGLSRLELRAAAAAGMRRISFGLESGSQSLLDAMKKGCSVELNSEFIRNAHDAGLSVRCTMFKGFPGETEADLLKTAEFLERHAPYIDRIRFNEFSVPIGTPIERDLRARPDLYPNIRVTGFDRRDVRARYTNIDGRGKTYRRAKARVLRAVYDVNRNPIRSGAQMFDGLM